MDERTDADAFEQGREAYKMGDGSSDNPFTDENEEDQARSWLEGFEYQKQIGQKHIG